MLVLARAMPEQGLGDVTVTGAVPVRVPQPSQTQEPVPARSLVGPSQ